MATIKFLAQTPTKQIMFKDSNWANNIWLPTPNQFGVALSKTARLALRGEEFIMYSEVLSEGTEDEIAFYKITSEGDTIAKQDGRNIPNWWGNNPSLEDILNSNKDSRKELQFCWDYIDLQPIYINGFGDEEKEKIGLYLAYILKFLVQNPHQQLDWI